MLTPKKQKFRKSFRLRGKRKNAAANGRVATSGFQIAFGTFGIKATTGGEVNSREIEAARRAMTRKIKRGGKVWIRVFPHKPVSKKGAEVPMGSGKGSVDYFVFDVLPGKVLFEMEGVSRELAREALRLAGSKISVRTKFIEKEH